MRRFWPKTLGGKALAAVGYALVLLAVAWIVAAVVMERRLAGAMKWAETEYGLPNNLEALIPTPLPPEQNAAVPLDQAAVIIESVSKDIPFWSSFPNTEAWLQTVPPLLNRPETKEVDRLLDEVDLRPGFSSVDVIRKPRLTREPGAPHKARRRLQEAEAIIAHQLCNDGKRDEAARRLLRSLRISRKWTAGEPSIGDLISDVHRRYLAMYGLNEVLRRGPIDPSLYDAIDGELIKQGKCHELLPKFYQIDKLSWLDDFDFNPARKRWWLVGPLGDNHRLLAVEWCNLLSRTSSRPYVEVKDELQVAADAYWLKPNQFQRLLHFDTDGYLTSHQQRVPFDGLRTLAACLRIVNAMARQPHWDAELDDLGLPADAFADPLTGGVLHLKRTPAGPVVYSVGIDLVDNGGKLEGSPAEGRDTGLGPVKR